jgi:hypothetical protein
MQVEPKNMRRNAVANLGRLRVWVGCVDRRIARHLRLRPRFWCRLGYVEVCRPEGCVLGHLTHSLIRMVKPVGTNTLADYLAAARHDRAVS